MKTAISSIGTINRKLKMIVSGIDDLSGYIDGQNHDLIVGKDRISLILGLIMQNLK